MAASSADKFTETKGSAGNPAVTTVSAARTVGGTSLSATALTNWPTDTQVHFITYSKNADGTKNNSSQQDWKGTISSSTSITAMALTNGTDAGNAIGDYIEMGPTASWAEDLYDGLTKEHDSTGAHDATKVMMLSGTQTVTGDKTFTGTVGLPDGSATGAVLSTDAICLGYAEITSNSTAVSSDTDVTGLSVDVTVPDGGRRVKVTVNAPGLQGTSGARAVISIKEGTTVLSQKFAQITANNEGKEAYASFVPTAGDHTYKVSLARDAGTGTVNFVAASTYPAFILVEAI